MKRMIEALVFCGLAALIHLGLMVRPVSDGDEAAGAGGASLASFQASSEQLEQVVAAWERPPEIETDLDKDTASRGGH